MCQSDALINLQYSEDVNASAPDFDRTNNTSPHGERINIAVTAFSFQGV